MEKEHAERERDRLRMGIGITRHLLKPEDVLESLETDEFFVSNKMPGRGWRDTKANPRHPDEKVQGSESPQISYNKKT
jgi:hypothetical protein